MCSEKKRGRPRLELAEDPWVRREVALMNAERDERWVGEMTRRHELNVAYELRASNALHEDGQGKADYTFPFWPRSVMAELGRCGDRAAIRAMAERLKGAYPGRAQDAVALVRHWRLGEKPVTATELAEVLRRAINRYGRQHPGLPLQTVEDAVWRLLHAVQHERERREGCTEG